MSQLAIREHALAVAIPYLLHFTRVSNLSSILTHGLYPIGRVDEINASPTINDQHRLDGHRDSTSISIGFPNCKMLFKYRMADTTAEWVILVLHPEILWAKNCAFCRHNAADARISSLPLASLKTPQAFVGMYAEIEGLGTRGDQKLKSYDPTDEQAEVLVFDVIEPRYIVGAVFEKESVLNAHIPLLGATRRHYLHANNKGMFANRKYARATWS